jgi:hypothetical protein
LGCVMFVFEGLRSVVVAASGWQRQRGKGRVALARLPSPYIKH